MVKVLFFANLRELANTDSIELELGKARIVRDLLETMSSHFPADLINSLRDETVMVSVNHKYAGWDGAVIDGDEIGLLPPVSGG